MTVERTLSILGVVKAIETDGALSQVGLGGLAQIGPGRLGRVGLLVRVVADGVVAALAVTSNHTETSGEGRDGLVATGGRVEEVVAMLGVNRGLTRTTQHGFAMRKAKQLW